LGTSVIVGADLCVCPLLGWGAHTGAPLRRPMNNKHHHHHRRSIRLRHHDYRQPGAYFVTICTQNRQYLFGEIAEGRMKVNDIGRMVQLVWNELPCHYAGVDIGEFVVMPNHFHGIIWIVGAGPRACPNRNGGQPRGVAPTGLSLSDVVHRFKSLTTTRYRHGVIQHGWPPFPGKLWQRNYYDHVIRDDDDLNRIRQYILENPIKWREDEYYVS